MAQYDFGTIDPNTKSGTALASDLNSWRNALHSTHGGSTAPTYLVAGMLWADTTSANYELKMYDGAQWIQVAVLDATNNVARVAVDSAETSYITSTTAAQIRHVIASTDIFTTRSTGIQFNIASPVIADSNNNELVSFTTTASAVNQINIANAATGGGPVLSAVGGDTNIDIILTPKGTGNVVVASGNVGIGTSSPAAQLHIAGQVNGTLRVDTAASGYLDLSMYNNGAFVGTSASQPLRFGTDSTERARIDASGNLLVGTTSNPDGSRLCVLQSILGPVAKVTNERNVSGDIVMLLGNKANANNTNSYYLICQEPAVANRLFIFGNGNVVNLNNSYGALSDEKLKENIIDSGSQWDDLKAVRVRKYSLKADNANGPNQIGVIAQELEAAGMGGLVFESPELGVNNEPTGETIKQVNYSVLYMKAVKALQEAMARIETLEAKVNALEAK